MFIVVLRMVLLYSDDVLCRILLLGALPDLLLFVYFALVCFLELVDYFLTWVNFCCFGWWLACILC